MMTCASVYGMAAQYLALPTVTRSSDEEEAPDPEDLLPYDPDTVVPGLLNGLAIELGDLADEYCRQKGMMEGRFLSIEAAELSDPLPLPDRFAVAAALYLAATLCLTKNLDLADALHIRYLSSVEQIRRELTAVIHPITDAYA